MLQKNWLLPLLPYHYHQSAEAVRSTDYGPRPAPLNSTHTTVTTSKSKSWQEPGIAGARLIFRSLRRNREVSSPEVCLKLKVAPLFIGVQENQDDHISQKSPMGVLRASNVITWSRGGRMTGTALSSATTLRWALRNETWERTVFVLNVFFSIYLFRNYIWQSTSQWRRDVLCRSSWHLLPSIFLLSTRPHLRIMSICSSGWPPQVLFGLAPTWRMACPWLPRCSALTC